MNSTTKRVVALAMVAAMLGAAGPAAADYGTAPAIDSSGTDDTGSMSEVQQDDTLGENNTFAANSSKTKTFQWIAATNNTSIEFRNNETGILTHTNSTPATVVWNSTDSDGHFNATVDHGEFADVEHATGENVTIEARMINDTSVDDANQTTSNMTFYIEWDNSTSVQNIDSSDVGDNSIATVTDETMSVLGKNITFGPAGETSADVETNERSVNGSNTDVILAFSNSSTQDMFDDAASDASSGDKLSSLTSMTRTAVTVSDGDTTVAVPVYQESAPDSVDENDTYAVYKSVGGTQALVVNLGDTFSDSSSVTVHAIGSAGVTDMLPAYASAATGSLFGGFMPVDAFAALATIPLVASRRREAELEESDEQDDAAQIESPPEPPTPAQIDAGAPDPADAEA